MIEVKEVLYRWTQGMGKKTIARSLGLARNTIREILNQAMGFGWLFSFSSGGVYP